MESVTRTIYGSALQTAQLLGIEYNLLNNSTLNQRFNVQENAALPAGQYPKLQYFCIGTGGVRLVAGADGNPRTEQVQHRAKDASCYAPFPFVLRSIDNDLSLAERMKYALRVTEEYNGESYVAYYLKRIDLSGVVLNVEKRIINDGVITSSAYVPDSTALVPVPPVIANLGANILTSEYLTSSAQLILTFTEDEITELLAASVIKYGTDDYANISEIGLCSGLDKVVSLLDGTSFKEAIGVQIVSHITTWHSVKYTNGGISGIYDVGGSEPLVAIA